MSYKKPENKKMLSPSKEKYVPKLTDSKLRKQLLKELEKKKKTTKVTKNKMTSDAAYKLKHGGSVKKKKY